MKSWCDEFPCSGSSSVSSPPRLLACQLSRYLGRRTWQMRSHDERLGKDRGNGNIDDELLPDSIDLIADERLGRWAKYQKQHVAEEDDDEGDIHHEQPGGDPRCLTESRDFQDDSH